MEEFIVSSLLFLLNVISCILILWALCCGTCRILTERSASLKSRLLWASLSVIPLLAFFLFHNFHSYIIQEDRYWFRDESNSLLPFLVIVCANNFINWIFRRRMAAKENP